MEISYSTTQNQFSFVPGLALYTSFVGFNFESEPEDFEIELTINFNRRNRKVECESKESIWTRY